MLAYALMNEMDVVKFFLELYYFSASLTMIKAVTKLDLGYNHIGDRGAHDLADVLQLDGVRILSFLTSLISLSSTFPLDANQLRYHW